MFAFQVKELRIKEVARNVEFEVVLHGHVLRAGIPEDRILQKRESIRRIFRYFKNFSSEFSSMILIK